MKNVYFSLLFAILIIGVSLTSHAQMMSFTVGADTGAVGDTVFVPVTVDNFTAISGYQGSLTWDSTFLDFIDITSPTPGINNIFGNPGQGLIPLDVATFSWINFSGGTTTLPAGTEVIRLRFKIKPSAPFGTTPVVMDSSVTNLAYLANAVLQAPIVNQGSVTVQTCVSPFDAGFLFVSSACENGFNPQALITGDLGGTFSVDNGASINSITGVLDLTSTTVGTTYSVSYTVGATSACPAVATQMVQILAADDASFTMPDTVCTNAGNPIAVVTGQSGGFFFVDNGASIDAYTGELDLASTFPGSSYLISYQTNGTCPVTNTQPLFVQDSSDASFLYPDTICPGSPNPLAIITGDLGGTFTVFPSATINAVTGELDMSSVVVGTPYTVSYTLNDDCQSSSEVQFLVEDMIPPDSAFLPDIVEECSATVPVPLTIDNCAGFIQGTTTDPLTYNAQGTYAVNWTFDDGNGNQLTMQQTVIVQDDTPPSVQCQDITIQLDASGLAVITPAQLDNGSADACGLFSLELGQDSFSTADVGANMVSLIATDVNGNSDSCFAMVTVMAYQGPVAICQDVTLYLDSSGFAFVIPEELDAGSTVAFGTPLLAANRDSLGCGDVGTQMVMLFVADSNGVLDSCEAQLTVLDTIAPVVLCQDLTVVLDSNGQAVVDPAMIDAGSMDACGIMMMTLSQDTFGTADIGTQSISLTVIDNNGNSNSCEAMITVERSTGIWDLFSSASGESIDLYPNPVQDQFTVQWESKKNGPVSVEIMNQLGQILHHEDKNKDGPIFQANLSVAQLPAGTYIVRIIHESGIMHGKMIKQ